MNTLNHVAIIADGNGRWATRKNLPRSSGHEAGLNRIEDLARECFALGIPVLTIYMFSIENWKRPQEELDALGELGKEYLNRYEEFVENNVKVLVSGVEDRFSQEMIDSIRTVQEKTAHCTGLILHLCVNYSGRREIVDAIAKGARTEEEITAALYQNLPEPDLIIRTGGFQRLSNFLLWQSAYTELYFTQTLFPDFSLGELRHAVKRFYNTKRKFGGE